MENGGGVRGLEAFTCVTVDVVNKDDIIVVLWGPGGRVGVAVHSIRLTAAAVTYADHLPYHVFTVLWILRRPPTWLPYKKHIQQKSWPFLGFAQLFRCISRIQKGT